MGQGGISPKKVFKREIKQKAQYGGKACVGPMEKKEPYLKGLMGPTLKMLAHKINNLYLVHGQ